MVKRAFPFSCSNTVILIFQSSYFLFSSKERWCQRLGCYLFPSRCPTRVNHFSCQQPGGAGSAHASSPAAHPRVTSRSRRPPELMDTRCKWRAGRGRRCLECRHGSGAAQPLRPQRQWKVLGRREGSAAAARGGPEGAGMRGAGSWGAQRVLMQQHESCARAERSPSCPDSPQPCAPCRIQLLHSSFLGSFQVPPTELASSPTQTSMTE